MNVPHDGADAGDRWRLRRVRRPGSQQLLDLAIVDDRIAAVVDHDPVRTGGYDADGRWLIPGLWDGHVHATQYAIQQGRIDVSAAISAADSVEIIAGALASDPTGVGSGEPVIAAGFRDGFWPEPPTGQLLEDRFGRLPVIVVSADLHCGWANPAAMALMGHRGHPTGVLTEKVWMDALAALPQPSSRQTDGWVADMLQSAVSRGVTGIRDFEFGDNLTDWQRRHDLGGPAIRVDCGLMADLVSDRTTRGLRTGDPLPGSAGLITMGPVKVFVDGSLNTRTALCYDAYPGGDDHGEAVLDHQALTTIMAEAADRGLQVAAHAIGDRANTIALDCFERTRIAGRIEHAQLVAADDLARFGRLGVIASVQPWHAIDDWRVADHYWAGGTGRAYPFADLARAGARIEFGSDAPVAPLDPWRAIAAAVDREAIIGRPWHPEQQLSIAEALRCSAGGRSTVAAGDPADLVLLDADPYAMPAAQLPEIGVHGTCVGGRWVYGPAGVGVRDAVRR